MQIIYNLANRGSNGQGRGGATPVDARTRRDPVTGQNGFTLHGERDKRLPESLRALLVGPGAPFEYRPEKVFGHEMEVFVSRPPHLREVLHRAATEHGDRPYLVFPEEVLSFVDVRDRAAGIANRLAEEFGVGKGDRVAVAAPNSLEYALAYWATLSLGAIMVGLNGWWARPELAYGIELTSPKLVLGDERRLSVMGTTSAPAVSLSDLTRDTPLGELPDVPIDEDDAAVVLFTSGTTGRPKGAALSHRNIVHFGMVPALAAAVQFVSQMQAPGGSPPAPPPQTIAICGSPFFHIFGTTPLLMTGGMHGGTLVFPPPAKWDEVVHMRLTEEHGVTSWSVVPTQLWRILQHPDFSAFDLTSLQTIGAGGSDFAPELRRLTAELLPGVRITNGYGMTETTGCAALGQPADGDAHPTAVGTVAPTMAIQVRNDNGVTLDEGATGEVWVRGATVFIGYWNDAAATASAFDENRWYRTGDVGRIEQDLLFLESRLGERIIRGGENVSPVEIENRLMEHPDILDAAVIGIPHRVLGQEVKAVVVPRSQSGLSAEAVRQWVRAGLAGFKVPAIVEMRHELPRTMTGKVIKYRLVDTENREGEAAVGPASQ
jgi:acyl-CoA synthetase (AMP-forming)/AMP-acid ligase II